MWILWFQIRLAFSRVHLGQIKILDQIKSHQIYAMPQFLKRLSCLNEMTFQWIEFNNHKEAISLSLFFHQFLINCDASSFPHSFWPHMHGAHKKKKCAFKWFSTIGLLYVSIHVSLVLFPIFVLIRSRTKKGNIGRRDKKNMFTFMCF